MSKSEEFVKGVWRQEPLIHTPQELTHLAKNLTSDTHPEFGEQGQYGAWGGSGGNELKYEAGDKDSASGFCDSACRMVHDYLPHGAHMKEYRRIPTRNDEFINHFVHHVPTTDGMYVVDYTHRQFQKNAKFPVVEPQEKFDNRPTMKRFVRQRNVDYKGKNIT